MTLGENIWKRALEQIDWETSDRHKFAALGNIVIALVDLAFDDLQQDHLAEMTAMESDRLREEY